jgi:hypothetical protein
MPGSVVTAGPVCNEGEFAEKIARFALHMAEDLRKARKFLVRRH